MIIVKTLPWCLVAVAFFVSEVSAQEIRLGGVTLSIGMPEERAVALLREESDLKPLGADKDHKFAVMRRPRATEANVLGTVEFFNGRLDRVTRQWADSTATPDAEALVKGLFALFSDGSTRSSLDVRVDAVFGQDPGIEARLIYFYLKSQPAAPRIILGLYEIEGQRTISLQETFERPRQRQP